MFKKLLVANRGEIAVRIVRACRDMGIGVVALYDRTDRNSLHVRLADEAVELRPGHTYLDGQQILQIALQVGAEAIHPGYGFLSEQASFIRACEEAGITFIGPPSEVVAVLRQKINMLETVRRAGFSVPQHSHTIFTEDDFDLLEAEASDLGYPLVVKSCSGGRGRATRLVRRPDQLESAVQRAHLEALAVFGDSRLFLERAILPSNFIEVQIVADNYGNMVHLGEREGSIQRNNQKLLAESPAPSLSPPQRQHICQMALDIARRFGYRNVGTVEFLLDGEGKVHFTEIKSRIQVEHPVTEMVSQIDLVREQIEIAAGKAISLSQEDIQVKGAAMQCRINAEDPWNHYLPSPGHLQRFRLPGGPNVRVDTYGYSGGYVPVRYDPILAKLIVWGENRDECRMRMQRSLQDFAILGVRTNLPLFQRICDDAGFIEGAYNTEFMSKPMLEPKVDPDETDLRNLAVAAAVAYLTRNLSFQPTTPERFLSGWHRSQRRLSG
jgi:acetyl/propionyl-CoA carboxylase alpha subunit